MFAISLKTFFVSVVFSVVFLGLFATLPKTTGPSILKILVVLFATSFIVAMLSFAFTVFFIDV